MPKSTHSFFVPSSVPGELARKAGESEKLPLPEEAVNLSKLTDLAAKCYARAARLAPDCAAIWHDLALAQQEAGRPRQAMAAARKALALQPDGARRWNLIGFLAARSGDFALAQHALSKSVSLEGSACAWANLGIVYLVNG